MHAHNSQDQSLIIVYTALVLLTLASSHGALLALLFLASLVVAYISGLLTRKARHLIILNLFILLGVLPLCVGRVDASSEALCVLWGDWGISSEGLALALLVYLRASTTTLLLALLLHQVPFYRLCQRLRAWHVPSLLIELIELSYRYINLLTEQAQRIYDAQRLRLGYLSWQARYQHTSQLIARSFILAHSESERMYDGLLTRQFNEGGVSTTEPKLEARVPSDATLLELQGLRYRYPDKPEESLRGISCSIGRGERIALLGQNGAGKSTLMRLLSGLIEGYDGALVYAGSTLEKSATALATQRRHITLVLQNSNHQLFCPSVEDEIAFGLRNSGLTGEALSQRVEAIIECYELGSLRSKAPHLLSEGQKKWVSIAAVMAMRPEVVLLDEPTACLDQYYTSRVLELLDSYASTGCTVILSTHDMHLAQAWASRALVLSEGALCYDGNPTALFSGSYDLASMHLSMPYGGAGQARGAESIQRSCREDYRLGLFHSRSSLRALIYGWGTGARRKAETLRLAGIDVLVVAPELPPENAEAEQSAEPQYGRLSYLRGRYPEATGQMSAYGLVIAATGIESLDAEICREADTRGKLYANLSDPEMGNIQFAALLDKAGIQLALHSHYRLPELSQHLRGLVAERIRPDWISELERLSELRRRGDRKAYEALKQRLIALIDEAWAEP
ncbi:MAG: CbiQ family ECF transporter T component [Porphyromonas sp.]|nr:CbiQ family ECF transporter T component [Porphyromonas sp.]